MEMAGREATNTLLGELSRAAKRVPKSAKWSQAHTKYVSATCATLHPAVVHVEVGGSQWRQVGVGVGRGQV